MIMIGIKTLTLLIMIVIIRSVVFDLRMLDVKART